MFANQRIHKGEKGQDALETVIVLMVFVVVAAIFAFTVLSAGSSSTEKGLQANKVRLESVQSTMRIKGPVVAVGTSSNVNAAIFTVSLVAGDPPINLSSTAKDVVIDYKDATQFKNNVDWGVKWIASKQATPDDRLEEGELAEITVDLSGLATPLGANTAFSLEIKPPKGAALNINRTTPAVIQSVMDLN